MATIDKKSVRNEFDSIKNELNNLSADKKIPPECKALFKSLILLFELILSIFVTTHPITQTYQQAPFEWQLMD